MIERGPIGVFDSGYGGLTVLKEIVKELPAYNYIYLGDNARAPYGPRSFETVYHYTLECVRWFFDKGCPLVILACNTASAKALRTIQQNDLAKLGDTKKVLGVIRPTTECIGSITESRKVGILGTRGTVQSESYKIEIEKFFPDIEVFQQACPIWVPLIENGEYETEGADFFIKKYIDQLMQQSPDIDTVVLACTHYPILKSRIEKVLPNNVKVVSQGGLVAEALRDYLNRHPEIEGQCEKSSEIKFFTTDLASEFDHYGGMFFGEPIQSRQITL